MTAEQSCGASAKVRHDIPRGFILVFSQDRNYHYLLGWKRTRREDAHSAWSNTSTQFAGKGNRENSLPKRLTSNRQAKARGALAREKKIGLRISNQEEGMFTT